MIPAGSMASDDLSAGGSGYRPEPPVPAAVGRPTARVVAIASPAEAIERELVSRARNGDRDAFGELALQHEVPLYRYLLRMLRNPDDAADQTQEAFLVAWRNLRLFDPGRPFRPWLYRLATNLAISMLRKRGRIVETSIDADSVRESPALASHAAGPDRRAEAVELAGVLREALGHLPPMAAAAVHLKYEDGKSMPEIAEILGKNPGAVAVLIHRARQKLRETIFGAANAPRGGGRQ